MRPGALSRTLAALGMAMAVSVVGPAPSNAANTAQQPYRLSDEQVERLLERIEKGADTFRKSLDRALDESRVDDTRLEGDVNRFIKDFEAATDRLEDRFADDRSSAEDVREVLNRAIRIDGMMKRVTLTDRAQEDWRLVRNDLDELARAYGVEWQWRIAT